MGKEVIQEAIKAFESKIKEDGSKLEMLEAHVLSAEDEVDESLPILYTTPEERYTGVRRRSQIHQMIVELKTKTGFITSGRVLNLLNVDVYSFSAISIPHFDLNPLCLGYTLFRIRIYSMI